MDKTTTPPTRVRTIKVAEVVEVKVPAKTRLDNESFDPKLFDLYKKNLEQNKAKKEYEAARKDVLKLMQSAEVDNFVTKGIIALEATVGPSTVSFVDTKMLISLVGAQAFLDNATISGEAVKTLWGEEIAEKVKRTGLGNINVTVKPKA